MTDRKYRKVPRESEKIKENEVRITTKGQIKNYIAYASNLLEEGKSNDIVLKGMGRAINKTVTVAEILKRSQPLHQITEIDSNEVVTIYEPLEEGLNVVEDNRTVYSVSITLSKTPLDTSNPGYQPPLTEEERQAQILPLGGGRKKAGIAEALEESDESAEDAAGAPAKRGRGGRGRGGRGRGRGGRGGYRGGRGRGGSRRGGRGKSTGSSDESAEYSADSSPVVQE